MIQRLFLVFDFAILPLQYILYHLASRDFSMRMLSLRPAISRYTRNEKLAVTVSRLLEGQSNSLELSFNFFSLLSFAIWQAKTFLCSFSHEMECLTTHAYA